MINAIKGTKDILPEESAKWQYVENKFQSTTSLFGYNELRTPIFESTEVFCRSIGDSSDIVNKEMYTFLDKGGESITLRPEMTAALVRACIQHNYLRENPLSRLWYFGPFFRYERPQKGRFRQFHQFGCECIGSELPEADAEVIILADKLINSLAIENYSLLINTLGTNETRLKYRIALIEYLKSKFDDLSEDSKRRMEGNPLRVLDSKDAKDIAVCKDAPSILDFLDEESSQHFNKVKDLLLQNNINFEINPFLVRGLDYYNHTVFEFRSNALGSQDSFGGGGRYDGLFEQLGGSSSPAVGFAMGVERLMMIMEANDVFSRLQTGIDIYIIAEGENEKTFAYKVSAHLRNRNLSVMTDIRGKKFKAQLKDANKFSAKYAIIIGSHEVENKALTIKNMKDGNQVTIQYDNLSSYKFVQ